MAGRTLLPILSVVRTGLTTLPAPTTAPDVANGNLCLNDGATSLIVVNTDSSPHTLTVQVVSGVDGLTAGPKSYPVLVTGQRQWAGVFPVQFYGSQLLFNLDSTLVLVQAMSFFGP
jgi:hypothetical protein